MSQSTFFFLCFFSASYCLDTTNMDALHTIRDPIPRKASALWNSMIHPLLPLTIYGAIWYQGLPCLLTSKVQTLLIFCFEYWFVLPVVEWFRSSLSWVWLISIQHFRRAEQNAPRQLQLYLSCHDSGLEEKLPQCVRWTDRSLFSIWLCSGLDFSQNAFHCIVDLWCAVAVGVL